MIKKYRQNYPIDFQIPKTYVITTDAFRQYDIGGRGVPDALLDTAVRVMKICGENVAVRSSATVEDLAGRTYSGAFKSVLSVQNRDQMKNALNTVYESLYHETVLQTCKKFDLSMGVMIQKMVEPRMAGVVYSETWHRGPFDVINYVENDVADKLVSGDAQGNYFAVGKATVDKEQNVKLFDLGQLGNHCEKIVFYPDILSVQRTAADDDHVQYADLFKIAALANSLEMDLGYPIDMEFAIDKNNCLNILQVRPYVLPTFYRRCFDLQTESVFAPGREILAGPAYLSDNRNVESVSAFPKEAKIIIYRDKQLVQFFTPKSMIDTWRYIMPRGESPFAAQYTHHGNMTRENLDFTMLDTFGRRAEYDRIKNGDWLTINLLTGKVIAGQGR
ncbi:hypothetical protein HDR63_00250 [bacterium]|nr:hypothetical protein [bacterium]